MAKKIKIRQKTRTKTRTKTKQSRKSRTYKGGSNATYSTTKSQEEYRTRMVQGALEAARRLEASYSGHSTNLQGPGKLSAGNAARYREYNKATKGTTRR